jgi:hypothetical protein
MKNLFPLIAAILLFTISCTQDEAYELDVENKITLDEVRRKFDESRSKSDNAKNARSVNHELGIKWDDAVFKELSVGEVITFPIDNAEGVFVSAGDGILRFPVETTSYARAYKNNDIVVLELIQPIPTENTSKFTGIVNISDWDGTLKYIYKYEDGNYIKTMVPVDSTNNNSRQLDFTCTTTITWFCTEATTPSGNTFEGGCYADDVITRCTQDVPDSSGPSPGETIEPGGSTGGGGSNGANPNEQSNCPHPFEPDLMVPCNDNTCGEFYESDLAGSCKCIEGYIEGFDGCEPRDEDPGFKICNFNIAFDAIPNNEGESSYTSELLNIHVPAQHSSSGQHVEAFWGAWCVTYGSSAININSSIQASNAFMEAWEEATAAAEIWLNGQQINPGNRVFSNTFKSIFITILKNKAGGTSPYIKITAGGCSNVSTTRLVYCN